MEKKKNRDQLNSYIQQSREVKSSRGYAEALSLLEKAHILSQPHGIPHLRVHFEMFKLAFEFKDWKEVWGQIPRMILATPGSWLGRAPQGNVGSTKMGIFEIKKD